MATDTTTSGTPVVPDVVLFAVDGRPVSAAEVVDDLRREGALDVERRRIAAGHAARDLREVVDGERRRLEKEFRSQRHLVAAEEMERWLTAWHLDVPQWRAHVRREGALAAFGTPARELVAAVVVDDEMLWATLVCGGTLRRAALGRAERMVTAAALGEDPDAATDEHVRRWREGAVAEAAVDRELVDRALDWLRVRWVVLDAPHLDAAREARLCLDDDHLAVEEVARRLGTAPTTGDAWLHRAPGDLREPLVRVDAGRTSEPLPHDHGHRLVHVLERRRPDPGDPTARQAVRTALADQALDLEVRDRVMWHVEF